MKQALNSLIQTMTWDEKGLIPVIVQSAQDLTVLMFAYMNKEALQKTLETGYTFYWSRSRQKIWQKGESSGHLQKVIEIRKDCDSDTLLLQVEQIGDIACHTGRKNCFFYNLNDNAWEIDQPIMKSPEEIYSK